MKKKNKKNKTKHNTNFLSSPSNVKKQGWLTRHRANFFAACEGRIYPTKNRRILHIYFLIIEACCRIVDWQLPLLQFIPFPRHTNTHLIRALQKLFNLVPK